MKMNIDTLMKEEMNENQDKDKNKIELIYKHKSLFNNYALIKINGKFLEDVRVCDIKFYDYSFEKNNMTLKLNIPLDKYEITINQDSEEKEK